MNGLYRDFTELIRSNKFKNTDKLIDIIQDLHKLGKFTSEERNKLIELVRK